MRLESGEPVFAPTPPPDIDLDLWLESVAVVADWRPQRLGLTHFGEVDQVEPHLAAIADDLRLQAERIRSGIDADAYVETMTETLIEGGARHRVADYGMTVPLRQNYEGLARWLERHGAQTRLGQPNRPA